MRKLLVVVCLVAMPLVAQDAAKVGPDVYKCIFENEKVRVCEVTFKPGASVAMHSHPQHLVYVMSSGKLHIMPAGKAPVDVDFKPGMAVWSDAETHSAVNQGKTELRGLVVELKEAQDPVATAVMDMEREWGEAMLAGNVAKIENIVADDWTMIDPAGQRTSRAQALDDLRSGALKFESSTPGDIKVNVYGDTAIVNGSSKDKGTYKGMDISGDYVFTDVFVKRDGKWRAVSTQVTRVMPPQ
ncbi:MAG TPA: DUF4440 domain-containing protein [Thermoanaerobaculia bacterium]|nr:DUF4440 domain-containing protein [Thermoanaerobaculia bacterium]